MPGDIGICLETLLDDPWRCDAAAFRRITQASSAAGFRSVALWSDRARELGVDATRQVLDDLGLTARLIEVRTKWAEGPSAAVDGLEQHLDLVSGMGAGMMLAISQQTSMDVDAATEGFAAICDRAATHGLRVTIEFLPCRALCDLKTAWRVVGGSGAANGGIDIDLMHWQHQPGGPDLGLLRGIPARHLHFVQVCDAVGPTPAPEDYVAAAVSRRPLPGDGEVDIPAVISVLGEVGADPFYAMEVFNADLLAGGAEPMARRLRAAAEGLLP